LEAKSNPLLVSLCAFGEDAPERFRAANDETIREISSS
jgi:hypothetical protein